MGGLSDSHSLKRELAAAFKSRSHSSDSSRRRRLAFRLFGSSSSFPFASVSTAFAFLLFFRASLDCLLSRSLWSSLGSEAALLFRGLTCGRSSRTSRGGPLVGNPAGAFPRNGLLSLASLGRSSKRLGAPRPELLGRGGDDSRTSPSPGLARCRLPISVFAALPDSLSQLDCLEF